MVLSTSTADQLSVKHVGIEAKSASSEQPSRSFAGVLHLRTLTVDYVSCGLRYLGVELDDALSIAEKIDI